MPAVAWLILAVAAAVLVIVEGLLVAAAVRRARAAARDTPAWARPRWSLEVLWTVLPALGLLLLGLLSARGLLGGPPPAAPRGDAPLTVPTSGAGALYNAMPWAEAERA
jgi:heme/copper-type cytochrome/quinol oxidase subunit 2